MPAALALLLLFRLLIPSGYMVSLDHEGRPGLTLCAAPAQAAAQPAGHGGHDGHPGDQAPPRSGDPPCPFAALAAPPLPPAPPLVAAPPPATSAPTALDPTGDTTLRPLAAPPPPATGPPPLV